MERFFQGLGVVSAIAVISGVLAYQPLWEWTKPERRTCAQLFSAQRHAAQEQQALVKGYGVCIARADPAACDTYPLTELNRVADSLSRLDHAIRRRCP